MKILNRQFIGLTYTAIVFSALLYIQPTLSAAQDTAIAHAMLPETDLDLSIKYSNRELASDGVLHENSYEETMMRRSGHVWSQRVLPGITAAKDNVQPNHEHKDFNYIVLPRHVQLVGNSISVEFINAHDRQVITIAPTEYENVNFDGSWKNTYYLIDPQVIAAMPVSKRPSSVANAHWHEAAKNGLFQRVLWNDKNLIPLIIETGNQSGSFFQRIKITTHAQLAQDLPWHHQQGYTKKEYSDFLD